MDPERPRRTPWWGAFLVTAAAAAATFAVLLLSGALRAVSRGESLREGIADASLEPLNLGLAQGAGFGAVLLGSLFVLRRRGPLAEELGLSPVASAALGMCVLAGMALQLPLAELSNLVQELWPQPITEQLQLQQLLTPDNAFDGVAIVLTVVLIAPVAEELLFRGLLLRDLDARHGPALALILSAALFGLSHGNPHAIGPATLAGLILGWLALRTGSILPGLALHAGVNALPVLLPARVARIEGFNTVSEEVHHLPLVWVVVAALVAAMALTLAVRMNDMEPE